MTNYITGENGFLLPKVLKNLKVKNCIIHFGSPSSIEEFTEESTLIMVNDVKMLLMLPHKNFLFASSLGVEHFSDIPEQQMYNNAKLKCETLIKKSGKNYCILRIPRVYGKDRKKGLMKHLSDNVILPMDKIIEFLDITDFIQQTQKISINNTTIWYNNLQSKTIRAIKYKYNKGTKI